MRNFGLIGYPLSHSFSKKYFTDKFLAEGFTDCSYENYQLSRIDEFAALLKNQPDLEGLNVTIPYKEAITGYLDAQSDVVQQIKACNCIKITGGKLKGFNTDVIGFERSLTPLLRSHHRHALILGTGGAAKAVAFVLSQLGIQFNSVSRKAGVDTITYSSLTAELIAHHTLIINTTPLGMYPNVDAAPQLSYAALSSRHYLYDLVYNPAETAFLRFGKERGAAVKNGADMLRIQAEESWRIWNS